MKPIFTIITKRKRIAFYPSDARTFTLMAIVVFGSIILVGTLFPEWSEQALTRLLFTY